MDRRQCMRLAAMAGAGVALGVPLAGCAASAVAEFDPAVLTWLADLAKRIAADEIVGFAEAEISRVPRLWRKWFDGVENATQGYGTVMRACYGHPIPPVMLFQVRKEVTPASYSGDPMRDGLLACIEGGDSVVYFEPWAWQALSMCVHSMTDGLSGQNLANAQHECVIGLIPSRARPQLGQSPEKTVEWMTYQARGGPVEIVRNQGTVTIKADGIWNIDQKSLVRQFTLPAHRVKPDPGTSHPARGARGMLGR